MISRLVLGAQGKSSRLYSVLTIDITAPKCNSWETNTGPEIFFFLLEIYIKLLAPTVHYFETIFMYIARIKNHDTQTSIFLIS